MRTLVARAGRVAATAVAATDRAASSPTSVSTDRWWSASAMQVEQIDGRRGRPIGLDDVEATALADVDDALEHGMARRRRGQRPGWSSDQDRGW